MQVERITTTDQLAALHESWNCLAGGVPFRSWQWLSAWWRHYGAGRELFVLTVRDANGCLTGLAPWFIEPSVARGRVVRFLGGDEVCSDYLSLLSTLEHEEAVSAALAEWLCAAARGDYGPQSRWDLLQLEGVAAGDGPTAKLTECLLDEGAAVYRRSGANCWRIELPLTWDEYLANLSKSHRKQVRRVEKRLLEGGRTTLVTADNRDQLRQGMEILVELHQRRRRSLNESGCFASPRFSAFLHEAAELLLDDGRLRLQWLALDGSPAAVEFHLTSGGTTYAYQAGVDPERLDEEPGRLFNTAVLKQAIERGERGFDFLRGDEPYKAHWRAAPRPSVELRIVPPRSSARLRHGVWLAGDAMKTWIKSSLTLTGMH